MAEMTPWQRAVNARREEDERRIRQREEGKKKSEDVREERIINEAENSDPLVRLWGTTPAEVRQSRVSDLRSRFADAPASAQSSELSPDEQAATQDMKERLLSEPETPSEPVGEVSTTDTEQPAVPGGEAPPSPKPANPGTDKHVSVNIVDNLAKLSDATSDLPPDDKESFKSDLAAVKSWYQEAQDKLDTRELVERMAHAFTQLGAGMWGSKHGVDMSGLKFDKTNWDAKMDRLLDDFKVRLGELGERRRESQQGRQFAMQQATAKRGQDIDIAQSQNQLGMSKAQLAVTQRGQDLGATNAADRMDLAKKQLDETIRHNQATEQAALSKGTLDTKVLGKINKDVNDTMKDIRGVMVRKEVSDEDKRAYAQSALINNLGMSTQAADTLLTKAGTFWDSDMDPAESMIALGTLGAGIKQSRLEALLGGGGAAPGAAAPAGRTIKVKNAKTGQIMEISEEQARAQKLIP